MEGASSDSDEQVHREVVAARRDPRLDHGPEAMILDWRTAVAAAERVRRLAEWDLHELREALEREEQPNGFRAGDTAAPSGVRYGLCAARERAQLAEAEIANEMAELNAMTLVALVGAVDAMVEALAPSARELWLKMNADELLERAEVEVSARHEAVSIPDELRDWMRDVVVRLLDEQVPTAHDLQEVLALPGGNGSSRAQIWQHDPIGQYRRTWTWPYGRL